MKTVILFAIVSTVIFSACKTSGHNDQTWKPHAGKKMKKGHNRH